MSYEVRLTNRARKQLARLPSEAHERVLSALLALEGDPRPLATSRKMGGQEGYRLRVGDYRALYTVDDSGRVVIVTRVGHRQGVYE